MSLLVLMYHRASVERKGNSPEMLDRHFAHIAGRYGCILPGEAPAPGKLNLCITFDDGYFDFYAIVFPLLKKHGLRALLAVPPSFVRERINSTATARLNAPANVRYSHSIDGGFCTWSELREMAESGSVTIAAHGYTHCRLDDGMVDWETELVRPQKLLSTRLGRPVDSFVFPYGRVSYMALLRAKHSYRYAFRIGCADNTGWDERVLYRVGADRMTAPDSLFTAPRLAMYRARRFWNRVRGR